MEKLNSIFRMEYGKDKLLERDTSPEGNTPLISSRGTNNGIVGFVDKEPSYKNVINVPRTGTICYAFFQENSCCINSDSIVLIPKKEFTKEEMIFITLLIRKQIFKYNYGRKVTPDRLGNTEIPTKFPKYIYEKRKIDFSKMKFKITSNKIELYNRKWKEFEYSKIFNIERGYYNKRPEEIGKLNFVSASMFNNGVTDRIDFSVVEKIYSGNCVIIVNNGHAGEAFYQKQDFTCSHDVNIIRLKDKEINIFISFFLIPLFKKEKYRFNYGRKWRFDRMLKNIIKLPVNENGKPDWDFMEDYIKSLPYSKVLIN